MYNTWYSTSYTAYRSRYIIDNVQCHTLLCQVMPIYAIACHVTSCHAMTHHDMSCHAMSRVVLSWHGMQCKTISLTSYVIRPMPYIIYHTTPYHVSRARRRCRWRRPRRSAPAPATSRSASATRTAAATRTARRRSSRSPPPLAPRRPSLSSQYRIQVAFAWIVVSKANNYALHRFL